MVINRCGWDALPMICHSLRLRTGSRHGWDTGLGPGQAFPSGGTDLRRKATHAQTIADKTA